MDAAFGGAPFEDPGRSYPSGPLAPSYPCGSYRMRWKASRRSEGILRHRSSSFIIVRHRSSSFIIVHHRSSSFIDRITNEGSGRSYPCGPLSPSYPCGSYRRGWKASRRSEVLGSSIIDHHRSSINENPGRSYPSGPLSPSYPCGNYRMDPKASRRSEGILRHRSSSFIIDHHRSSSIIIVHHRSSSFIIDHHRSSTE
jgi:hypothetical protein